MYLLSYTWLVILQQAQVRDWQRTALVVGKTLNNTQEVHIDNDDDGELPMTSTHHADSTCLG